MLVTKARWIFTLFQLLKFVENITDLNQHFNEKAAFYSMQ
jgi:hypothetical protein